MHFDEQIHRYISLEIALPVQVVPFPAICDFQPLGQGVLNIYHCYELYKIRLLQKINTPKHVTGFKSALFATNR